MEAVGAYENVKGHISQAKMALAVEQFGEATVALSLAYISAARLPLEQRLSVNVEISLLATEVERAYRLWLERKRKQMEADARQTALEKDKKRAEQEWKRRELKMPQKAKEKTEVKIDELAVQANVTGSVGDVAILKVTSAKLGAKADAQKVAEVLKNKPVLQIQTSPALRQHTHKEKQPLKLNLGAHRHLKAVRIEQRSHKPRINIGSIS